MRPIIEDRWINYFKKNGYPNTIGIATGMEGAVYSLVPNEIIAKVWAGKSLQELKKLQVFYEELSTYSATISTPKIIDVIFFENTLITVERFLKGTPLNQIIREDAAIADDRGIKATIEVLRFLSSIPPKTEFKTLAILDEVEPLMGANKLWGDAIYDLLLLRYNKFKHLLQADIPEIENIIRNIEVFLRTRNNVKLSLIHGDLCGCNIMVDDSMKPLSVFDFGFLSSVGDPAFDASISSAIFNMYGENASKIEMQVTNAFSEALGYEKKLLLAYKAVYSIITSNAYSKEGTDGHYQWCVKMLKRKDVQDSLTQ